MSTNIRISTNAPYQWPSKCVICKKDTNVKNSLKFYITAGFSYYLIWATYKYTVHHIDYPVCQKHKILIKMAYFFYCLSIGGIFLSGIFIAYFYLIGELNIYIILLPIILFAIAMVFRNYAPIRLKNPKPDFTTLIIKDDQYAREFSMINGLESDQRFKG